jgi:broad specificity phosphatase PhoE
MNRLILIRHGQSEHHIRGLTGGWTDMPLSQLGSVQARALADYCRQRLDSEPSPFLFSSDLQRAAQTAGPRHLVLSASWSRRCGRSAMASRRD